MAQDASVRRSLELVGDGYIYGATGWRCTEARRRQQAEQYPEQSKTILGVGKRWDGKICWDCAQATREIARAGGVTLPSGATSQWQRSPWVRKGSIDTMPEDEPCYVYRGSTSGKMEHTGFSLGDGTCVHAKGTAYGVLREAVRMPGWTHWATPWGTEIDSKEDAEMAMTVFSDNRLPVRVREAPDVAAKVLCKLSVGTKVTVEAVNDSGWARIKCDALGDATGYMMSLFLSDNDAPEADEDAPGESTVKTIAERLEELEKRVAALEAASLKGGA